MSGPTPTVPNKGPFRRLQQNSPIWWKRSCENGRRAEQKSRNRGKFHQFCPKGQCKVAGGSRAVGPPGWAGAPPRVTLNRRRFAVSTVQAVSCCRVFHFSGKEQPRKKCRCIFYVTDLPGRNEKTLSANRNDCLIDWLRHFTTTFINQSINQSINQRIVTFFNNLVEEIQFDWLIDWLDGQRVKSAHLQFYDNFTNNQQVVHRKKSFPPTFTIFQGTSQNFALHLVPFLPVILLQ